MSLEIVIGPMFSGKSSHAMAFVRRQRAIGKSVIVIKPDIDNRYSQDSVLVTHNKDQIPCKVWPTDRPLTPVDSIIENEFIVIEEAQFFKGLHSFVQYVLKAYNRNILLVGLDGDASQQKFGEILHCIPYATSVTKLCALCSECKDGTLAPFTKKIGNVEAQVDVGGNDKYVPVCLTHLNT
jgi:thymidine kinase